jgi:prepilin peptidase CpaA
MLFAVMTAALVALVGAAAWTDVRVRRIPNALTMSGFLVALALHSFAGGGAVVGALLGAGLALLVSLPLFALGGMGGGDVKLLAAVGAFLGPQALLVALFVTALAGGLMAVVALRVGMDLPILLAATGAAWTRAAPEAPISPAPAARKATIPYGVAIAVGALAGWFL